MKKITLIVLLFFTISLTSQELTGAQLVEKAISRFGLSARAYHRILKVARTIADLAGSPDIQTVHLTEAIGYRRLDTAN